MTNPAVISLIYDSCYEALSELVGILPFLFVTFVVIEIIEYYFFDKISSFVKHSGSFGPIIGALLASFPQCGFSIIASVLYVRGLITRGTLIAVYISTSDEAVPVLISVPGAIKYVAPIIAIKIITGIIAGYLIDSLFPFKNSKDDIGILPQKGCCEHDLDGKKKSDLIVHPVVHTFVISIFIFVLTAILNFVIALSGSAEMLGGYLMSDSILQPIAAALVGLIPNCAVSVAFIMLFIKGSIIFPSVIAGLSSNAGLGIWVIITKDKSKKDVLFIISSLLLTSAASGLIIYFIQKIIG